MKKTVRTVILAVFMLFVLCAGAFSEGEWTCLVCGYSNPDSCAECMSCLYPQGATPEPTATPEVWVCQACNTRNGGVNSACWKCHAEHGSTPEPAPTATPEPWTCPTCGKRNGFANSLCWSCKTARNAAEPLSVKAGDHITFGHYPQTAAGTDNTPIEWRVLDVRDGKALVISEYVLDCVPFNTEFVDTSWEKCSLRTWMNESFLNAAFTSSEQNVIVTTAVDNSFASNGWKFGLYKSDPSTQDRVFLLSYAESAKYFGTVPWNVYESESTDDVDSRAPVTEYAASHGSFANEEILTAKGQPAGCWWLRSAGFMESYAAYVIPSGAVYFDLVSNGQTSVRPALWLDLSAAGACAAMVSEQGSQGGLDLSASPNGVIVAHLADDAPLEILGSVTVDGTEWTFVSVPGTTVKGYTPDTGLTDIAGDSADASAFVTATGAMSDHPVFTIAMEDGRVMYGELYPEIAPETVGNFAELAENGFYDGLNFHRVIEGFMIQGGDPLGTGSGGPDYCIRGEFSENGVENDLSHTRGVLSMARGMDEDSAGSQFFIVHADATYLDGQYAAFGLVLGGMDEVDTIASVPVDSYDRPCSDQIIRTIHVETFGKEYSFTKLTK